MDSITVVLAVAVVAMAVVLTAQLVRSRSRRPAELDDATLRRVLAEALGHEAAAREGAHGAGTRPSGEAPVASTTRRHAAEDNEPVGRTAPPAKTDETGASAVPIGASDRDGAVVLADADRIRQRAMEEAEAQRAEITAERSALSAAAAALADERAELAADRDRTSTDRADLSRQRSDLAARERALQDRAAAADRRQEELDAQRSDLESASTELGQDRVELQRRIDAQLAEHHAELARISSLTVDEARAELLASQEDAVRRDASLMIRRIETEAQATAKQRARAIVADSIQRIASDQTSQSVVSVLQLPSDDLKGRIIGREGRNIRAFETVTGVNVIIDDTPEAVLLSCFDPVRREVGRVTLQALIDDGRIHPHRIEEAYDRAYEEVESLCQRAAEDALIEVGIGDIHPELVTLIGRLKYRTSYGQNVLGHLVETSHIARLMAAELGIDPTVAARGAFLHDIGKALTHEAQGSHAIVGADVARRFGESADVVHCIEAHHDEVPPATVEAVLTQAADACSGGRPGARRESLEAYVQRLEHIEAIASAKKGVDKVFAMQAGRELRVMVKPELIDDLEAHVLAREVAKQIEEELTYPGQVRVTVIRESRATEVAR